MECGQRRNHRESIHPLRRIPCRLAPGRDEGTALMEMPRRIFMGEKGQCDPEVVSNRDRSRELRSRRA